MPYKTFVNGFPLNASELNTFVMPQTNAIFADATERTAAIATPIEGQLSYLQDQNKTYRYDGSAWVEMQGMSSQVAQAISPNVIINGAFDIWQRGTSFSYSAPSDAFQSDRWKVWLNGTVSFTVSQQSFTPGSAPVSGYEGTFFHRLAVSSQTSGTIASIYQKIEDVRTLAGQTATLSFWAKHDTARTIGARIIQNFGSGGSADVVTSLLTTVATTNNWVRYSATVSIPSITGKTIGSGSSLWVLIDGPTNTAQTLDIWGVQLEAGSVATPFRRNANSLQGELAACQRYYVRYGSVEGLAVNSLATHAVGFTSSTTEANCIIHMPVTMRAATFTVDYSNIALADSAGNFYPITSIATSASSRSAVNLYISGLTGLTANRPARVLNNANGNGFIGLSTEL